MIRISKKELVSGLIQLINSNFRVPRDAPGRDLLREELVRFQTTPTRLGWKYSGKHHEGSDDLVMALALSVLGIRMLISAEFQQYLDKLRLH